MRKHGRQDTAKSNPATALRAQGDDAAGTRRQDRSHAANGERYRTGEILTVARSRLSDGGRVRCPARRSLSIWEFNKEKNMRKVFLTIALIGVVLGASSIF